MKHITLAAIAVAGATLAGCASTNQVLASEVDEVFHTPASPDMVAACFAHRMHLRLIERLDGTKVAQIRNGWGGVTKTFSVYPEGTGSRIESRHNAIGGPIKKWKRCVGIEPMRPGDTGGTQ